MKNLLFATLISFSVLSVQAETLYGEKFEAKNPVSVATVAAAPMQYVGKNIVVEGQIERVCKKKGCWFEFATAAKEPLRVTFKDYGFFIPKDADKKKVLAQGTLTQKTLSVAQQRHILRDAKAPKSEAAKIKEPKETFEFVASGVLL